MDTRLALGTRISVLITVVALVAACGGGSGVPSGTTPGTLPGTVSGLTVLAMGGTGSVGDGGGGGDFYIEAYTGGDIKVMKEGSIVDTFVVPTIDPDLGPNPLTVNSDMTLTPDGSDHLLGDDGINPATGLRVLPGYTLTLRGNESTDGNPATMERADVDFDFGIILEGTLTGYADETVAGDGLSLDALDLEFLADNLLITQTATVNLRGKDAAVGSDGGEGGRFDAHVRGTIINHAPVTTRGGGGDNGGDGGRVDFYTWDHAAYNTGPIDTSGGQGLDGTGGDAERINFHTHYGLQRHSGRLIARGGDGTLGGGGGGSIDLDVCDPGTIIVNCTIDASGGDALLNGNGGHGDDIWFGLYQGPGYYSGTYTTRGGQGAGSGLGGDGGDFDIDLYDYEIYDAEHGYGVYFAANLDLSGGDGSMGGHAGDVEFYMDFDDGYDPDSTDHQGFWLLGYAGMDLSGGNGSVNGGDAGDFELEMEYGSNYDVEYIGSIYNEVSVVAIGGDGQADTGGAGGDLDLTTYDDETFHFDRRISNTGDFDLRGGDGPLGGGSGGDVWMYEYNRLENLGRINTTGGDAAAGAGGDAGYIEMVSDDVMINRADLRADGGASTSGAGGDADYIDIYGRQTTCVGALSCCGGDSNSGAGGDGGDMDLYGVAVESVIHGSCIVIGGLGAPVGETGEVWLDGVNCNLSGGQILIP